MIIIPHFDFHTETAEFDIWKIFGGAISRSMRSKEVDGSNNVLYYGHFPTENEPN